MRVMAIRHRALLAWRLPPRLRRWRMVRPDDAWTGLFAAQCCEGRFRLHAFGVVTSCDQQGAAAVSAPTPEAANSAGLTLGAEMVDLGGEFFDFGGEGLISAGQGTQRLFGVGDGDGGCSGTETGAGFHPGFGGQSP